MFAILGVAVFVASWGFVASRLAKVGAGGLRRHLFGFSAAAIALGFSAAVVFPHADVRERQDSQMFAQVDVRPAATPASAAEWAEIQKFVQDIWSIAARQGAAQKQREAKIAASARKFDLDGVRKAQVSYLTQLDVASAALRQLKLPNVADKDGAAFIAKAYDSLHSMFLMEREQADAVIKGIKNPAKLPAEHELASLTRDINRKSALTVLSLHRIYWNYGYQDEDFDEKTFALKKAASAARTVSFNREES